MTTGSPAERLDHAIEQLIAGGRPQGDASLASLLEAASLVRAAMPPLPAGERFEERLLSRLTHAGGAGGVAGAAGALHALALRELRHPGRILAAGAVSSAAVGVTVTALVVWRARRNPAPAARAGHR